jgi:nucleotide-binding universal stress UspA family protein
MKQNKQEDKMKRIKTVLVPVDLTSSTKSLVDYALYIAESHNAVINFLHVVSDYPGDAMIGSPYGEDYQEKAFVDSKHKVDQLVADSKQLCPGSNGEVVGGDPVNRIVEYAEKKKADLIIIGTHGAKGLEKMILGNVAEHVLRKSPCPVLIMNPFKKPFHG